MSGTAIFSTAHRTEECNRNGRGQPKMALGLMWGISIYKIVKWLFIGIVDCIYYVIYAI